MFIAQVPPAMDKLIEAYQVSAGGTGVPCGALFDRLNMVESAIKRFEEAQTSSNVPRHAGLGLSSTLGLFSNAWGALPNGGLSYGCANLAKVVPKRLTIRQRGRSFVRR